MKIAYARHFTDRDGVAFGYWDDSGLRPDSLTAAAAAEITIRRLERGQRSGRAIDGDLMYEWIVAKENFPISTWVIFDGYALCIYEPRGRNGLEGYSEGMLYPCQRCYKEDGQYFKLWPGDDPHSTYYETIGTKKFESYFQLGLASDGDTFVPQGAEGS